MAENRIIGNVVPFASQAVGTDRTVFGDVTQSDDINLNVTAKYKEGWGMLQLNEDPTMQDFNALGFTQGSLISYLYQQGIAQWDANQEYLVDSVCTRGGKIFISSIGTVATPNVGNTPILGTTSWREVLLTDSGLAFGIIGGSETDAILSPVTHLSVQFVATERKILITSQLIWETQNATLTDLYADIELFDVTTNVVVGNSLPISQTVNQVLTFAAPLSLSLGYDTLTIGKTYEIRLRCWKGQLNGPMIPRNMQISALMI